jgi:hypothetical protein
MFIKRKINIRDKEYIRYWKDNRIVSVKDVPQYVLDSPVYGHPITEGTEPVDKSCIFCGEPAKGSRFIHMKTVFICDEHIGMSTGQVGAKVRELQSNS